MFPDKLDSITHLTCGEASNPDLHQIFFYLTCGETSKADLHQKFCYNRVFQLRKKTPYRETESDW